MPDETPGIGTSVLNHVELVQKATNAENSRKFELLFDLVWESLVIKRTYDSYRVARLALTEKVGV